MSRLQRVRSAGWVLGITLISLFAASSPVAAQPFFGRPTAFGNPLAAQRLNANRAFQGAFVGMLPPVVEVNWAAWNYWNQLSYYRAFYSYEQALVNPLAWSGIPDPLGRAGSCMNTPLAPLAPNVINPFAPNPDGGNPLLGPNRTKPKPSDKKPSDNKPTTGNPQPAPLTGPTYLFGGRGPIGAFPQVNGLALGLGTGVSSSPAVPGLSGLSIGIGGPNGIGLTASGN